MVFLYTAPVFAALGLHLKVPAERLGALQMAGIVVAFVGIAIAFLGPDASASAHAGATAMRGSAMALLAGMAWGATTMIIRCSSLSTAPATEVLMYQLLGCSAALLPTALFSSQWYFDASPIVWAHLAFQAVVVSFASFLTWCWLLRRYLASRLGVLSFLTPLLGEPVEPPFLAGGALVLLGIALVSEPVALLRKSMGRRGR